VIGGARVARGGVCGSCARWAPPMVAIRAPQVLVRAHYDSGRHTEKERSQDDRHEREVVGETGAERHPYTGAIEGSQVCDEDTEQQGQEQRESKRHGPAWVKAI